MLRFSTRSCAAETCLAVLLLFPSAGQLSAQAGTARELTWGGDSEGGAPFQSQDPRDPTRLIGFEVDLVELIGRQLRRSTRFIQNQWDGLVPGLERGNYDMIVSGLEITPDRAQVIRFSRPYYLTFEQLAVRKDTYHIESLADCQGKKIGTLKGSLAQRMLEQQPEIEVVSYDGQNNPYQDLANGRLDAVLMDHIIALYNVAPDSRLKMVGGPIGRLEYGIGIRKEDEQLQREIDAAIAKITASGELRDVLEKWGLWTPLCAAYFVDPTPPRRRPDAFEEYLKERRQDPTFAERFRQYTSYLPLLAKGALVTLELSVIAMSLAVLLGLNLALVRLYGGWLLRTAATVYVEALRGTPLLIQLFLIFYGLPHIGIRLSPMVAAILGLALNYSAYEAENYRAGIQSIPRTQMEAALALGMNRFQALRHVIVPQAMRLVLPPVTNDFIALLKDSSLVSVITMVELTKAYGQLASMHYDYLGIGLLTAAMYFLIGLPFVRLARYAERRFTPGRSSARTAGGQQSQAGE